ncbi:hypothetical protein BOX15_Mlig008259g2, partial [Macrostomum lignano]
AAVSVGRRGRHSDLSSPSLRLPKVPLRLRRRQRRWRSSRAVARPASGDFLCRLRPAAAAGRQFPAAAQPRRLWAGRVSQESRRRTRAAACLKRELLHLLRRSMLRCGSGGSDRLLGDFGESLDRLLPDDFNDEFGEDELSAFSDTSCLSGDGGDSLAAQLAELRIGLDACLVVTR